jgi:glycosyltransferase involved in cell wall biosynthesis
VLLDAWADAFGNRTDVRLKLVGKGILGDELRAHAQRRGIAAQVDFLGHRDKVEDEIAQADAGVLCSRIEGLSNTLLEFMASGLPTIASRISGSEDFVVNGRNGWMFEPSDVAGLATCLRDAAAATPERLHQLGQAARADVEAKASVPKVVNRLIGVYRGGGAS